MGPCGQHYYQYYSLSTDAVTLKCIDAKVPMVIMFPLLVFTVIITVYTEASENICIANQQNAYIYPTVDQNISALYIVTKCKYKSHLRIKNDAFTAASMTRI